MSLIGYTLGPMLDADRALDEASSALFRARESLRFVGVPNKAEDTEFIAAIRVELEAIAREAMALNERIDRVAKSTVDMLPVSYFKPPST